MSHKVMVQPLRPNPIVPNSIVGGKRVCPHCLTQVQRSGLEASVSKTFVRVFYCIACQRETVSIAPAVSSIDALRDALAPKQPGEFLQVIPPAEGRAVKAFRGCPETVQEAYAVASRLASIYPPAAAAMARKAIELLLDHRGYRQKNLVDKLDALGKETDPERRISVALLNWLDALREFGNFGLHPIRSKSTAEIVDVEEGEADLCLSFVEELVSELCERPLIMADKASSIAAKLNDAGKAKAADKLSGVSAPKSSV